MSAGGARGWCLLVGNRKVLTFCYWAVRIVAWKEVGRSYPKTLGSFLILSFTPWSPNERERKVDSDIPGNARGVYTGSRQFGRQTIDIGVLTGERIRSNGFNV